MADLQCPVCGGAMTVRKNRQTGQQFYGCLRYPYCTGIRDLGGAESKPAAAIQGEPNVTLPPTLEFRGVHLEFLRDETPEIDLEGALSCGKTIVCLWKELEALRQEPGIWSLIARYTEGATQTLLRPQFEQLARIHGTTLRWNHSESAYEFQNGSRCFAFGLKTQSTAAEERYAKIRGLPVSRIYVDQAEQLPADIASELRARLRPDVAARLRGQSFRRQLTFSPNPPNFDHWLAKQFPPGNTIKGRKYYALSLFDNAHNLPPEMLETMLTEYPVEHPKHQTVILGQRGLNVVGEAVYDQLFHRPTHVRPVSLVAGLPLLEAFEIGRHNPVWLIGQRSYHGALHLYGGVLGRRVTIGQLLPVIGQLREAWCPRAEGWTFKSCSAPMGAATHAARTAGRRTLLQRLTSAGYRVEWRPHGNAPDVRLAMIEYLSDLAEETTRLGHPALAINDNSGRHWLTLDRDGTLTPLPFVSYAFEGGYVWSDHAVSVANKEVKQPHEDDQYANVMHAIEHLALNFCADELSADEREQQRVKAATRNLQQSLETPHANPTAWMGQ